MHTSPQAGIFALGTGVPRLPRVRRRRAGGPGRRRARSWPACASRGPRSAASTWSPASGRSCGRSLAPDDAPARLAGFNEPVVGPDGYALPATQHDVVIWLTGASYDVVFDLSRGVAAALAGHAVAGARDRRLAVPPRPRPDRLHRRHREPDARRGVRASPWSRDGQPGAGGSVLLLQQWEHDVPAWEGLGGGPARRRRSAAARPTAPSSTRSPPTSHVSRTDQDAFGKIFRRNIAYGSLAEHGTIFVGFCANQPILAAMLDSMVGRRRPARRADAVHPPADGRLLLRPVVRGAGGDRRRGPGLGLGRDGRLPTLRAAPTARRHPAARPSGPAAGSPAGSSRSGSGPATGRCGTG